MLMKLTPGSISPNIGKNNHPISSEQQLKKLIDELQPKTFCYFSNLVVVSP